MGTSGCVDGAFLECRQDIAAAHCDRWNTYFCVCGTNHARRCTEAQLTEVGLDNIAFLSWFQYGGGKELYDRLWDEMGVNVKGCPRSRSPGADPGGSSA